MKVLIYIQGEEDLTSLTNLTDLKLENIKDIGNIKLLIDLETKEVKVSDGNIAKMIFSNIDQFLTYYEGINIIKENNENNS